jgi:hypothetical protein
MAVTDLLSGSTYDRSLDTAATGAQTRKGGFATRTLSGTTALDHTYPAIVKLNPNGASRDVTLDPVANCPGLHRRIINAASAAENLVCKNVGGTEIGTINQNEQGEFYCDGATWTLICITTIALS